jgi:hypothetical protein
MSCSICKKKTGSLYICEKCKRLVCDNCEYQDNDCSCENTSCKKCAVRYMPCGNTECEGFLCEMCVEGCLSCNKEICTQCSMECIGCFGIICSECLLECGGCSSGYCVDCLDGINKMCSHCIEKREAEAKQAEENFFFYKQIKGFY